MNPEMRGFKYCQELQILEIGWLEYSNKELLAFVAIMLVISS